MANCKLAVEFLFQMQNLQTVADVRSIKNEDIKSFRCTRSFLEEALPLSNFRDHEVWEQNLTLFRTKRGAYELPVLIKNQIVRIVQYLENQGNILILVTVATKY